MGLATDYPSFDVFVAHSSRSRSVGPAPDLVCLYKDLTEHYKNQYPDAGVKTVVVSLKDGIGFQNFFDKLFVFRFYCISVLRKGTVFIIPFGNKVHGFPSAISKDLTLKKNTSAK